MSTRPTTADYRTMIESAPEAIIVYTPEKFLFVNRFAAERLGADPKSLIGHPIMEFVHADSAPVVVDRIRQLADTGEGGPPLDVRFVSRSGNVMPAEIVSVPIVYDGQKALLGLIRDISKRAAAEQALRESEEKFANAFRQSPHGMAFVAPDGRWLKANRALCEMLGYTEEELLERRFADVTHPDDVATDLEQLRQLVAREISSYNRIKRYRRKDGSVIWVSLAVSAVHNAEGVPIYCIGQMEDITSRRALEEERAHAQRRAGISETTIAVAHELNNVLTALVMNAELLASNASIEEIPEIAAEILTASTRIASTVERLRKMGDPKSVDYLGERKMLDLSAKPVVKPRKKRARKKRARGKGQRKKGT
ncbi:MAG TPA: PAS domain S-box protein [Gemmatimonadaceae bacterium]|jgi:PAS domain S-box-containing protein